MIVILNGSLRSMAQNVSNSRVTRTWVNQLKELVGQERFFAFTFLPSFYLELQVPNPYYNSVLYVGSNPPEHFQRNVAILSEEAPRYILLDYATVARYGHVLNNPVDDFIRLHYRKAWELPYESGTLEIWERS